MSSMITKFRETDQDFLLDFEDGIIRVDKAKGTIFCDCCHIPGPAALMLNNYERLTINVDSRAGVTHIFVWTTKSENPLKLGCYLHTMRAPAMRWLCHCAKHLAALQAANSKNTHET